MTFIVADRVQETTNSPGTGTATLLGAVSGYQSFSTGVGANNTTFYVIADQLGTNWEVGLGALNSTGTVLTRTTVYSSSNGGSTVNFATGTQYVWCDFPSSKAVIQGTAVNFSSIGATTAGTGAFTTLSASSTISGAGFSNYFAAPPTIGNTTPNAGTFTDLTYTGTLTGGTGVVNLGSGQFYKDASGNVGIGVTPSTWNTDYKALQIGNYSSFYGRVSSNETGIMNNMYRNGSAQYTYLNSAAAAWYYISGSSHNWTSSASGTAGNAVTTTQVLSVDRGLTLALQGASSNSGTGITFPATQSASSDANTLDDYEEGTWTPVVSMNSGTSSGGSGSGTYIKIGRQVTVTMYLNLGTVSVGGTINGFTGFPFNSQNTNQVAVGLARENANTGFGWEIRVNANDSSGLLRTTSSNSANVATGDTFVGTVTYFTS